MKEEYLKSVQTMDDIIKNLLRMYRRGARRAQRLGFLQVLIPS